MTGILKVANGESRINGTLLGRKGDGDPYGAATGYLQNNSCRDGDCVTVTGTQEDDAFYITTATKEAFSKCVPAFAMVSKKALDQEVVDVGANRTKKPTRVTKKVKKSTKNAQGTRAGKPSNKQLIKPKKKKTVKRGKAGRRK